MIHKVKALRFPPLVHSQSTGVRGARLSHSYNINSGSTTGSMSTWIFLVLLLISHNAFSLNILGIFSMPLRSHYMAFKPLFREFAKRGHNVTIYNNFPDAVPQQNLEFVNLFSDKFFRSTVSTLASYEKSDSTYWEVNNFYKHVYMTAIKNVADCDNLFVNENVTKHLVKGVKYDVIFVEQFMSDCGLVYAAAMYDAPIIGITSHVLLPWAYPRLGIPFNVDDPFYFLMTGSKKTLFQKVETYIFNIIFNTLSRWNIQRNMNKVFERHIPNFTMSIEQVARERMKMMFAYQHFSITGARLSTPQVLEIGGIHIADVKSVPGDIEKFMSTAEHGVIYFSFGSNLKSSSMTEKKMHEYLKAFKRIPQKVLWKWENDTFPTGHDNILAKEWLPQLDILCHPKVLAFITHGGMLSLSEAVHCGKPMLVSPFFGDQFTNADSITNAGIGNVIMFDKVNADNLVQALNELTSERMQQNAKKISVIWRDRPQKVMDSAIYWTEYVARHNAAPPSLPHKFTSTFESLQLDVYALLVTLAAVIIGLIYYIFKFVIMILFSKTIYTKKIKVH